jgi:hypothetical protein
VKTIHTRKAARPHFHALLANRSVLQSRLLASS